MKIRISYFVLGVLLFACFFGFYAIPLNIYSLVFLSALLAICSFMVSRIRNINIKGRIRWILYIVALFVSGICGFDTINSFKYILFIFSILISAFAINKFCDFKWYYVFLGVCLIENIAVILHFFIPNFINKLNVFFLPDSLYSSMINSFELGSYAGIAADLPNAMFFSMSILVMGMIFFMCEGKKLYLLFAAIGTIGVFLSGKRSGLLILIIVVVVLYFMYAKKSKTISIRAIVLVLLFFAGFIYILYYTDIGKFYIMKNDVLQSSGDLSNGRAVLNEAMYKIFKENPVLGIGSLSTAGYYGSALGHNIYLQTLSENGIFGFIFLISILILNFRDTIKKLIREKNTEVEKRIYFSIFIQVFFMCYGFLGNPLYGAVFLIPYILFSVW